MIRFAIFVLAINLASGQLNYEGNPFTEYTEYIAQESNLSEKSARKNDAPFNFSNSGSTHSQKLYPIIESESDKHLQQVSEPENGLFTDKLQKQASFSIQVVRPNVTDMHSARHFQVSSDQNTAEFALNTFLNSKTPEESRLSLDHYIRSQNSPTSNQHSPNAQYRSSNVLIHQDKKAIVEPTLDVQRPLISQVEQQQQQLVAPQVNQQLTSQVNQGQLVPQLVPQGQLLPPTGQAYDYVGQPPPIQPVIRAPAGVILGQGMLQPVPLMSGFQRSDMITPAMWRERMRRIRGQPFPFAQPRLTPGVYKGAIAVPFKSKAPIEVIYTKPPGFHRGPPIISNPPIPYEDASAWFPEADHPPSQKDVYYSQLYAQSYDPHYYNYIATTGKIRPHLYGKLGKNEEEKDTGIWSELYRGFTKHGLKNIMTPTFLLGMTLPVVTLMLSALVQKRSIARSDGARELDQDVLREYLERLQRAMECYADRNSQGAKLDAC
ncbi:uncharacterized protein LOC114929262 isoform X2 [Nylanderia fulva]|nr:uncharacterized protein LOC114929262 isoform X2 [Nylanderia fulva]XP_029156576.1 uncharacterized protein LOC114929262 isoform X2 [Nylanderia fulva]XP_029156578.1 uncharacterized protein LOC114929262 isoform X2 [Nylanderia fulva]